MNKNDLRATLGSIHASDELVSSTMAKIEARGARSESRGAFGFGLGFRVAAAACALMLVVGLGIYGAIENPPIDEPNDARSVAEANDVAMLNNNEEENSYGLSVASSGIDELLAESDNIDGDWVIIDGVVEACFFAGGEDSESANTCIITVAVADVEHTSGGIAPTESISLKISFNSESEMQSFIDNYSEETYFLIVEDGDNGDTALKVKRFVYK